MPHPRVCTEFFHSDVVFVGTVTSAQIDGKEDSIEGWFYRLDVVRVFRGRPERQIEVYTENASARFPLELHHTYLLFANRSEGHLQIDCCGNSSEIAAAQQSVNIIEEIMRNAKHASSGDISGRVVDGWFGDTGVSGIRVTAYGRGRTFTAVSDAEGRFHMQVPRGQYRVWPEATDWYFRDFDIPYEDSGHVNVSRGGCSDLLFFANRK